MYLLIVLAVLISVHQTEAQYRPRECDYQLVETMPENMTYKHELPFEPAETYQVFQDLINNATKSIQLVSFYTSLTPRIKEHIDHPSSIPSRLVLEALESAARDRNVNVEIILGFVHDAWSVPEDLERFESAGIKVKHMDVAKLIAGGVQHSKFLIVDERDFYLGSANLDWRAFTQVKEIGILYENCKELAEDLSKIFKTYSLLADNPDMIDNIPDHLSTKYFSDNPLKLTMNEVSTKVFLSAAPRAFKSQADPRTDDIDAIINMISKAKKFVYVSVMKFRSFTGRKYWPVIENALRAAVYERKVTVKLLITKADKIYDEERGFYRSLKALSFTNPRLGRLEVRLFRIPSYTLFQANVPYSRLKHDKYVVTDYGVHIGTSNWEQEYFEANTGVGISIIPDGYSKGGIVESMTQIFNRDYYSEFSQDV